MTTATAPPFECQGTRRSLQVTADLKLSYLQWHSEGVPVLLLHGMADQGFVWTQLAQSLNPTYHCVAPDLRGHGESGKPNQGYSCRNILSDLRRLVEHLGWEHFHLVSHSWSAKIATVWATHQPERITSLTLVDPFFIQRLPGILKLSFPILYKTLPFLKTLGPFPSFEAVETVAKALKQYRTWSPFQQALFQASIEQKADGQWGSKFVVQARDEIFADVMKVAGLTQVLSVPTLFVKPEQGLNRSGWQFAPYHKFLSNLTLHTVPGNHWPFLVEPAPFNETIATFLKQVHVNPNADANFSAE